jgi:hypothetical protein
VVHITACQHAHKKKREQEKGFFYADLSGLCSKLVIAETVVYINLNIIYY